MFLTIDAAHFSIVSVNLGMLKCFRLVFRLRDVKPANSKEPGQKQQSRKCAELSIMTWLGLRSLVHPQIGLLYEKPSDRIASVFQSYEHKSYQGY